MNLPKVKRAETPPCSLETAMSGVASAIADPSRARMLCALMDGRAWTATEMSAVADIATSTASAHLAKLLKGGLIICVAQGRHRYYRLAGQEIAGLLEAMMGVSMKSLRAPETRAPVRLRRARTCYDHLAGEVAVEMYEFMLTGGWISADGSAVTVTGKRRFQEMGVVLNPDTRRKPCCACLDWSERRFHLGGDAGAALLSAFVHNGWLVRVEGYREVTITEKGQRAFSRWFQVPG